MEKAVRKFMWSQRYNVSVAFGLASVISMIIGDYYGFMLLTIVPLLLSFTKREETFIFKDIHDNNSYINDNNI